MSREFAVLLMTLALTRAAETPSANLRVEWEPTGSRVRVLGIAPAETGRLRLLSANEWPRVFAVTVEPEDPLKSIGLPAMIGIYSVTNGLVEFAPAYPLEPGLSYRATFFPDRQRPGVSSVLRVPRPKYERDTVVSNIYPSASVLPQNLLKFYLHFSAPMSGGHIYEHIHLAEEDGTLVELPFLEIDEELWNPEMTRLTLFLDPGRIKREVRPLEEVGPALVPGKRYTLTIDEHWLDARGVPLKEPFVKKFSVVSPDREPPEPARWKITAPKAGSREPLRIDFTDPMDHALAIRMIGVAGMGGRKSLGNAEQSWFFEPDRPWEPGRHELLVRTTIEDLAGNNIGKPFEVDLQEENRPREEAKNVSLFFQIQ